MKHQTVPDQLFSYLDEQGNLTDSYNNSISDEMLLKGYRTMVLTRLVDERMVTLQRQGLISFALSSLGEEACAVSSAAALKLEDWLYPQYREVGVMFWRGFSVQQYLHHMFGNQEDLLHGRQMPNHFGSRELNIVTVSSPIGTKIPHAAGCAYAMKLQQEKTVALSYFGEGATSEGDFHSGLTFAAVRKAPVIFFCRNNGYAISTPATSQFHSDGVAPLSIGHGIKTFRVDGNDFFAIYEITKRAREICLKGEGPVFIEAMTYRMGAHSTSDDPSKYRSNAEVEGWKKKCPILRLRHYLENQNLWDNDFEKILLQEIKNEIDEAIKVAKECSRPELRSLVEDVYFEVPQNLEQQYEKISKFFSEESKS